MLQILDLSGNAASLLDGPAFSCLPHLQELYLRYWKLWLVWEEDTITHTDLAFRYLYILGSLWLTFTSPHNRRMQLGEFPSDILRLHQLRILDLSQNSLQSIPVVAFFLCRKQELGLCIGIFFIQVPWKVMTITWYSYWFNNDYNLVSSNSYICLFDSECQILLKFIKYFLSLSGWQ